jgi:hypothetical protein
MVIHRRALPLTITTILYTCFVCKPDELFTKGRCDRKKIFGFDHAASVAIEATSTMPAIVCLASLQANWAKTAPPAGEAPGSVDKPLNIHRIECVEPPDLNTADLLSSFTPLQKQALSRCFERP